MKFDKKLNLNPFLIDYKDCNLDIITTGSKQLKDYYVIIATHDKTGKIVKKTQRLKYFNSELKARFEEVVSPIFCLITTNKKESYFDSEIKSIISTEGSNATLYNMNRERYLSSIQDSINDSIFNIAMHYAETDNKRDALGLLVFDNESNTPTIYTFHEFSEIEKEITDRKEILEKFNIYYKQLVQIKADLESFIPDLIDFTGNTFKKENVLARTERLINVLLKIINNKKNYLYNPTLDTPQNDIETIEKFFNKIKSIYAEKEKILIMNERILSDRNTFITQAITNLELLQKELTEKAAIDEMSEEIKDIEIGVRTTLSNLKHKKENIIAITEENYEALKNECNNFIREKKLALAACEEKYKNIIDQRKKSLTKNKDKLIDLKISELEKIIRNKIIIQYKHLLEKIYAELESGCIHIYTIESINNETMELLPQLENLKQKHKVIEETNKKITIWEEKLELDSRNLHGTAIALFRNENFINKLNEIKNNLNKLLTSDYLLAETSLDAINESFKNFQTRYEETMEKIIDESKLFQDRYKKINTELDVLSKKFVTHIEKLKGEKPIKLRDRLINFIFKATTKEKIRLEEQGIHALVEIKNYIDRFSTTGNSDTDTLKKSYVELDSIFNNKSFTKHRSLLFKRNPTTSASLAREATELVDALKIEFKA